MIILIDTHSHLQLPEFDADRTDVILRMQSAGVKTITVGVDEATSRAALALAEEYPSCLWATVGTHPADGPLRPGSEASGLDSFNIDTLRELAVHPKAVGIGECGLDYYRLKDGAEQIKEKQKEVFRAHIAVAKEVGKPLMIHCRPKKDTDDAYEDLIGILSTTHCSLPTVIHFFVGSVSVAEQLLALGCYFTFGGVITFTRDYDEVIAVIPLSRILAETDAPYVTPVPYRGKRNEPAYVEEVVKKLAELKGVAFNEVARITVQNARAVWKID